MISRRAFLQRCVMGSVALALASRLPGIAWAPPRLTVPDGIYAGETLRAGDMFTIEGRHVLHPITRQPLPLLQRFVVTADVEAGPIPDSLIYPTLRTDGPYANTSISAYAPAAVVAAPVMWG